MSNGGAMREIKFRAFSDKSGMWDWEKLTTHAGGHPLSSLYSHDGWQVMQFTGLRDKNGVEIYEGDVLRMFISLGDGSGETFQHELIVLISFQGAAFWFTGGGHTDCNWHFYNAEDREVIGNIYESPELLNQK